MCGIRIGDRARGAWTRFFGRNCSPCKRHHRGLSRWGGRSVAAKDCVFPKLRPSLTTRFRRGREATRGTNRKPGCQALDIRNHVGRACRYLSEACAKRPPSPAAVGQRRGVGGRAERVTRLPKSCGAASRKVGWRRSVGACVHMSIHLRHCGRCGAVRQAVS